MLRLTHQADAPPLPGESAELLRDIWQDVKACEDFRTGQNDRQFVVMSHIEWLLDPESIPKEWRTRLAIKGPDLHQVLIDGALQTVWLEWHDKTNVNGSPDSCLYEIGAALNGLLIDAGGNPLEDFPVGAPE
jgi:hypothetical protein